MNYSLPDLYKLSKISITPKEIEVKLSAIKHIIDNNTGAELFDLIQLYYNIDNDNEYIWFKEAFTEYDSSFSMVDSTRELAILSTYLINNIMQTDSDIALSVLTSSFAGTRSPLLFPELIEISKSTLLNHIYKNKAQDLTICEPNKYPIENSVSENLSEDDLTDAENIPNILVSISSEKDSFITELSKNFHSNIVRMNQKIEFLQEESNILWWLVGEYSNLMNEHYSSVEKPIAAITTALELSELTISSLGPASSSQLLYKVLNVSKKSRKAKFKFNEYIENIPTLLFERFAIDPVIEQYNFMFPVYTALKKYYEIGNELAWCKAFRTATGLSDDIELSPIDLSTQLYRESLLLKYFK
ncbi:hypothetical protein NUP41_002372 [Salmonella enterica]|nr:hypothetical protein [Salmonella enterica]